MVFSLQCVQKVYFFTCFAHEKKHALEKSMLIYSIFNTASRPKTLKLCFINGSSRDFYICIDFGQSSIICTQNNHNSYVATHHVYKLTAIFTGFSR